MIKGKSIILTGGAGYCGSRLVSILLDRGYKVTILDNMYFGNDFLPKNNDNLSLVKGDIRDSELVYKTSLGHDYFISLACVSNDASFELNEKLSTSVNMDAFEPMVIAAKKAGISRFIYASSSSVYGVSDAKDVTEDHPLVPLTLYNKYKGLCEPILLKHTDDSFEGVIFRPATVCGFAPRMRLDLSVNILTNFAVNKNLIKVFGGSQLRPNLHVQDYCEAILLFLNANSDLIKNQIFNVGYQNLSIKQIALMVKKVVQEEYPQRKDIEIITTSSDDNRSYHISSEKIKNMLGFVPKFTVEDAVRDVCNAFKKNLIPNSFSDDKYFNVKLFKRLNVK